MNHRLNLLSVSVILSLWMLLGNCYFNPIVNGIVNPAEEENNNSTLGLLGLAQGTSNLRIIGQIRDPNGAVMVGLGLTPSAASNIKSTSPYTTDEVGRFYLPYQSGRISFDVSQNGSPFFTLVLNVSNPTSITAETSGAPLNLEISNLGTISASETPSFFELVDSTPSHNAVLTNPTSNFNFTFSEAPIPALTPGPLVTDWIAQNITMTPSVSFNTSMSVTGNTLTITSQFSLPGPGITYEITLKTGVLSATGKPLTPRTIRFLNNHAP